MSLDLSVSFKRTYIMWRLQHLISCFRYKCFINFLINILFMLYSSIFLCKYCPGCSLFILHNFTHILGGLHSLILRFLLHPLLWLVVEVDSSTIISIRLFLRLESYHELFFTMCSVQIFYPWKNLEGYVPTSGVPNPPRG